jgi:hypothetical protein
LLGFVEDRDLNPGRMPGASSEDDARLSEGDKEVALTIFTLLGTRPLVGPTCLASFSSAVSSSLSIHDRLTPA